MKANYVHEQVLSLLKKSPRQSMPAMEKKTGISYQRVRTAIKELRALECPPLHIAGWEAIDPYHTVALFSYGPGEDVPKPPRTPKRELNRRSRERRKKIKLAKEAAKVQKAKLKQLTRPAFRHPQDIAFFGPPPVICPTAFIGNLHVQPMEIEDELEEA